MPALPKGAKAIGADLGDTVLVRVTWKGEQVVAPAIVTGTTSEDPLVAWLTVYPPERPPFPMKAVRRADQNLGDEIEPGTWAGWFFRLTDILNFLKLEQLDLPGKLAELEAQAVSARQNGKEGGP